MTRIDGEHNAARCELAIIRRNSFERPDLQISHQTRLCITCIRLVNEDLRRIAEDPSCLQLNVLTQTNSKSCLVCNSAVNIHKLSFECRLNVFIVRNIYIPDYVTSCIGHLDDRGYFLEPLLAGFQFINRPYVLKGREIQMLFEGLRNAANDKRRFSDEHCFTNDEFSSFSPVTKEQFVELFNYCEAVPCDGGHRYVCKKDLLLFLCKLRQGLSDDFLRVLFEYPTRQAVSLAVSTVRKSLMQRFVPESIGFDAITREQYIDRHVSEFANALYNNEQDVSRVIAEMDGTYLYTEKSSNYRTLRQSFSLHKHRHLVKPVLIVAPDGYILDIQGPYFADARNNDASILENEFERDAVTMRHWFQNGDILIVDRGYRDSIPLLNQLGITWKMPALLPAGRRQLTTEEANDSRLVTKTRWVVEARNGHLKSIFKFFERIIGYHHTQNLSNFLLIAGGILNRYHPPLEMQGADAALAQQMLERANTVNVVQARVEAENLKNRIAARWVTLTAQQILDFPVLDIEYLRNLTFGIYQIQLAPSYIQDKLHRENQEELQVEMLRDDDMVPEPGFIRVRVYSRFRNVTKHQLWIAYTSNDEDEEDNEDEPIQGYYCTCKSGARTLGSCAHVASIIWYLGYAQYQQNIKYPSTRLLGSLHDAANRPLP